MHTKPLMFVFVHFSLSLFSFYLLTYILVFFLSFSLDKCILYTYVFMHCINSVLQIDLVHRMIGICVYPLACVLACMYFIATIGILYTHIHRINARFASPFVTSSRAPCRVQSIGYSIAMTTNNHNQNKTTQKLNNQSPNQQTNQPNHIKRNKHIQPMCET